MFLRKLAGKLFGRSRKPQYTADAVTSVFLSCGAMCRNCCYFFSMEKKDGGWHFSGNCFLHGESPCVELKRIPVTPGEAEELLTLLRQQNIIANLQGYRPSKPRYQVMDETTYRTDIRFADGGSVSAAIRTGGEMEAYCYRLAEKYGKTV